MRRRAESIAAVRRVNITCEPIFTAAPVAAADHLRAAISEAVQDRGASQLSLPSGAGHDAQIIAEIAPVGMIFVPSESGVSHVPEENTRDQDLVTGAQVFLSTVLKL